MADNKKMQQAKAVKNDEFYTEYGTISDEMGHYRKQFEGQVVYCNCDDPAWSNFWKYFHSNFGSLKLKKLICTHYEKEKGTPSYALIYEGGDDFNMEAGYSVPIHGNDDYNAGDFRSDMCIEFLKESTIVVTNPPFSLFREYMAQLIKYGKKFIVLGNQNAVTTKEIFPLFKENKVWYGQSLHGQRIEFRVPDDYPLLNSTNRVDEKGNKYIRINGGIRWFTNIDVKYRHDGLWHKNGEFDNTQAHCYYEGNENRYPQYDNYLAINVDATKEIPIDYEGVMGVPITWLDKYSPLEFTIIGMTASWDETSEMSQIKASQKRRHNPLINGKEVYRRILIRNTCPVSKIDDKGF